MPTYLTYAILGTGNIAAQFCAGVLASQRGQLVAVGSRDAAKARAFADKFQIPAAYGSYEDALADAAVQAVYISLPNSLHHEWTLKALRAGKHVLCEKPIATSLAEAQEMFDEARKNGRILVEAFMYRSHPLTHAVLAAVRSGAVGQVRLIRTSFCYRTTRIAGNIRFDPALAGGALMDVGCYCIDFSRLMAGQSPSAVHATARLHPTGVDEITAGTLHFPGDILAPFACGMTVQADNTAFICGDGGYIEIPFPWKPPAENAQYTIAHSTPPRQDMPAQSSASSTPAAPPRQTHSIDARKPLYACESDDFAATILDNAPPRLAPQDSLATMRTLDTLRRQVGVVT